MIRRMILGVALTFALAANALAVTKNISYGGSLEILGKEIITGETSEPVCPIAVTKGRLWGVKSSNRGVVVTKTPGATAWTKCTTNAGLSIIYAWPTSTGAVLYSDGSAATIKRLVHTGSDITSTTVLTMGTGAYGFWYSMAEHDGTLILSEYGSPGRKIYRSTNDGVDWTEVYDFGDGIVTHIHCVAYHAGTGRWLATTGDGAGKRSIVQSVDDGVTWTFLQHITGTDFSIPFQSVRMYDYGDPTKIWIACDSAAFSLTYDLVSKTIENIVTGNDFRTIRYYSWSNYKTAGGMYYASGYTTATPGESNNTHVIMAGSSPANLRPLITYQSNIGGLMFIGEFDGYMEMLVGGRHSTSPYHARFKMSRQKLLSSSLNAVYPAVTNLYGEADSTCNGVTIDTSGSTNWKKWTGTALTEEATGGINDGHCLKCTATSAGNDDVKIDVRSPVLACEEFINYTASVWVKGENGTVSLAILTGAADNAVTTVQTENSYTSLSMARNEWNEIRCPAISVPEGHAYIRLRIRQTSTLATGGEMALYIDNPQIVKGCGPWTIGGAAGSASEVTGTITPTDTRFEDIFCFVPGVSSYELTAFGETAFYVKSWACGEASAKLYWWPEDSTFKLVLTDGTNTETITTAATSFVAGQSIWFSLRVGDFAGHHTTMSMDMGFGVKSFSAATYQYPFLATSTVSWTFGDADGANGFYGWMSEPIISKQGKYDSSWNPIGAWGRDGGSGPGRIDFKW